MAGPLVDLQLKRHPFLLNALKKLLAAFALSPRCQQLLRELKKLLYQRCTVFIVVHHGQAKSQITNTFRSKLLPFNLFECPFETTFMGVDIEVVRPFEVATMCVPASYKCRYVVIHIGHLK